MKQSKGYISKIETFATADGPGIRTVIFFAGCTLRCLYCHNPDMWTQDQSQAYTVEELMSKIKRMKPYFKNGGGVSFCGGEPLFQSEFLIEMLKACQAEGIHTVLDTAGVGNAKYFEEVLEYTDLILLDIKGVDEVNYYKMTQQKESTAKEFLSVAISKEKSIWLRHVVIPNMNDTIEHIQKLYEVIKDIPLIEKVELLPYHTLGNNKYEKINEPYPLEGVLALEQEVLDKLQTYLDGLFKNQVETKSISN